MSIYNMDYYRTERRRTLFFKVLAWIGIVAAGSLLVFCAGVYALREGLLSVVASLIITILMAWGIWGFVFLKNRH